MSRASPPIARVVRPPKRRSLKWQFIMPLNAAVVIIISAFLAWDGLSVSNAEINQKRIGLQQEAEVLAGSIPFAHPDRIQGYLDDICGRAHQTSPGHHIAVKMGSQVIQAHSNHLDPDGMFQSMVEAASQPDRIAEAEDGRIVVGSARSYRRSDVMVYVLEHLDDVLRDLSRQVMRRLLSILLLGVVIAVVVNLLVSRLVSRPLKAVVDSVRRVRAGHLGAQAPAPRTEELGYVTDEFNAMSAALDAADRERRDQMDKARRIQEHLLPDIHTATGLKLACVYEPASEVGGDYFDVRPLDGGTEVLLCVADVTGHGVPAAMGAAMLKTLLVSAATRDEQPDRILAAVGKGFESISLEDDFASMFVAMVDRAAGRLRYASAGHPPAFLLRAHEPVGLLSSTGPLLGVPMADPWQTILMEIRPGDRLIITTDGLMEAANARGEFLGLERLIALVNEHRVLPLDRLCQGVMDRIRAFRGSAMQNDDMTMLAVEF